MEKEVITSYKGFNSNLSCRDFQYEVGKEYAVNGEVKLCVNGFHASENPLDVLDFYNDFLTDRYCIVEQYGDIDESSDKIKIASSNIRIKEEIGWDGLLSRGVEWMNNTPIIDKQDFNRKIINDGGADYDNINSTDDNALIGSSGCGAEISSNGKDAQIASSGYKAKIVSSGIRTKIASRGICSQIASSGYDTIIGSIGSNATISSSGNYTIIGSSDYCAAIASSGDDVRIISSGTYAHVSSSGDYTKIASKGNYAFISSNGIGAEISSSGEIARIATSGTRTAIESTGKCAKIGVSSKKSKVSSNGKTSVIACVGEDSIAKAKVGSWITLSEWEYSEDEKENVPLCVKTEYVDGERIKEDTWYKLEHGEFVEVNP